MELYLVFVASFLLAFWFGNIFCLLSHKERVDSIKEYRSLKAEVDGLADRKAVLEKEVEELSSIESYLSAEVKELRDELSDLEALKQKAWKEGYEAAYGRVIEELRSLRAQKSAVVELFVQRCPELNAKLRECTGMEIVRYLKKAKEEKLAKEDKNAGLREDIEAEYW